MVPKMLIILLFSGAALGCNDKRNCEDCVATGCDFVVTKTGTVCSEDYEDLVGIKSVIGSSSGCKIYSKTVSRNGNIAVVRERVGTEIPLPTTTTTEKPSTTTTRDPVTLSTSSKPTTPTSTLSTTAAPKSPFAPPTNSTVKPVYTDRTLNLSSARELFFSLESSFDCPHGVRNETVRFAYSSALCSIARLSNLYGIEKFADTDRGWFLLNPAREFHGMCKAISMYRKRCRKPEQRPVRRGKRGITRGPRSPLFSKVDVLWDCNENELKEERLHRLARIICYAGELFLTLKDAADLNVYDLAWGLRNPSYRHELKCTALFRRKRRCFK